MSPTARQHQIRMNSNARAMVYPAEPAPVVWWFHAQLTSGAQPRRMNGPMSPVAMNVPVRNQRLTIRASSASTIR